jgi:hypothetical protein
MGEELSIKLGRVSEHDYLRGMRHHLAHHDSFREVAGRIACGRERPNSDDGEVAFDIDIPGAAFCSEGYWTHGRLAAEAHRSAKDV